MTRLLSIDPGVNSGVTLGFYDDSTPYRLEQRWQVHGGLEGFISFWQNSWFDPDEIVCEKFILDYTNDFTADLTSVLIEGALVVLNDGLVPIIWQPRTDKAALTGYPAEAVTKAQRQRVRFDFLEAHGLFKAGTEHDDSNDTIGHALVSLKRRKHMPTLMKFWPPRAQVAATSLLGGF